MKTRKEQNKILKVGIKDFHIVTNVLHVHMKRNAVMQTEFDKEMNAMKKTVAAAVLIFEAARKRADLAKITAEEAKKKKG